MACFSVISGARQQEKNYQGKSVAIGRCKGLFNQLEKLCGSSQGRDKVVKAAHAYARLAQVISDSVNGSSHVTTLRAKQVADVTAEARDVFALFNVFGGCLTSIKRAAWNTYALTKNILQGDPEKFGLRGLPSQSPSADQRLSTVTTKGQKLLGLVEQIGCGVGALTYSVAFGICRVIRFIGKTLGKLDQGAKKVVGAFTPIMFVNHIAVFIQNGASLARNKLIKNQLDKNQVDNNGSVNSLELQYAKDMMGAGLGLTEKALELVCDLPKIFGAKIGTLPVAIMGAAIGTMGLAKAFIGGYEVPKI